ncbi:unnamed protein product [Ambrosiozyma monospora]|uniref:Unnamed protein product n=1 Tax=Ambrosiozyma monospora TaxID=43982 RepID=A0ACB5STE8_AMBMO|nr:unnamed protein product [Ambrosiozyma monospora]
MAKSPESVAVVGAGLVGSLVALGLARKGYKVTVFDYRPDSRDQSSGKSNLRSINLAVSARGIDAMRYVDEEMSKEALKGIIPMYGRMIHDTKGKQESQIYGLFGESINSIDRAKLNESLYDQIDKFNKENADLKIELKFKYKVKNIDLKGVPTVVCVDPQGSDKETDIVKFEYDFIIGADGAFSQVRSSLQRYIRMNYSQEYIDMCYLELYIPPGPNGSFSIDPNHLHIWPRKDFMLIALANADGSFTSTFFGPWKLTESLKEPKQITEFFTTNFPDAVDLIGIDKVVECFTTYPKGALMHVTCNQYHHQDKCIIIGDAAHSMTNIREIEPKLLKSIPRPDMKI